MTPILGFIGWHNSGKTTVIREVVRRLRDRGYKIAVIKSTKHRGLNLDSPGSDSNLYRKDGIESVVLVCPDELILFQDNTGEDLKHLASRLFPDADLVIGEGFKYASGIPKIEITRAGISKEPLRGSVSGVKAVVSDYDVSFDKVFKISQIAELADFIENSFLDDKKKNTPGRERSQNRQEEGPVRSHRHGAYGCLVVVEGIDGTGKTTLARNIYLRLKGKGFTAILTFEPTDGPWGKKLRRSFSSPGRLTPEEELEFFLRDRKGHVERIIRPSLEQGKIVVCDRYYFSTMAYQGARGLDPEAIRKTNETFAPVPDLVFLLELDPETAIKRIMESRGEVPDNFEQLEYLKKVAGIFKGLSGPFVARIDATLPPEELLDSAWDRMSDLLNKSHGKRRSRITL